jgi:Trk-type K+ transport system membrane component
MCILLITAIIFILGGMGYTYYRVCRERSEKIMRNIIG